MSNKSSQKFLGISGSDFITVLACLTVVLLLFIPTLSRPWLIYDEKAIFDNTFFPSPSSFSEIFETFREFGLNFNYISSNIIYSSNSVIRSSPVSLILNTFIHFFLKKNSFYYHIFILILHMINTTLVYFIIKRLTQTLFSNNLITALLTLIWAVHPVIIESVLLSTNFPRLITYTFFFGFFLDFLNNRNKNNTILRRTIIPLLFLIPMFSTECIIILPFVFFIVSFQELFQTENIKTSLKKSFEQTFPYFTGVIIYLAYFIFIFHAKTSHPIQSNELQVFFERVFWLSPQIFFHSLKLIFYPAILSIDQSLFVRLGKAIYNPYAIFCFIFTLLWLALPLYLLISKKRFADLFFMTWAFFFTVLPFLHILMPSYLLSAERYLYCPLAFLIFSTAKIICKNLIKKNHLAIILLLSAVLICCFIRSHYRVLDWKDNYSFISSNYRYTNNSFLKGVGLGLLAKATTVLEPEKITESKRLFSKSLKFLRKAKVENKKLKFEAQRSVPSVIKSYGLDYDSILAKIAYLEVSSRCLEFNENSKIVLKILSPLMKSQNKLDPRLFELYAYLLTLEKQYSKARDILLKANSLYPHTQFILNSLFDLTLKHENNSIEAEKYLVDSLKYYIYDTSLLTKAHDFYQSKGDLKNTARYAYLFALRTHSKSAYQQALSIYLNLGNMGEAGKIVNNLLKSDLDDIQIIYLISKYYYKLNNYQKSLSYLKNAYILAIKQKADDTLISEIRNSLTRIYSIISNSKNE